MTETNRRGLMLGLAGAGVGGAAIAQTTPAAKPAPTVQERLTAAALRNARPMRFDGDQPSGPGWDFLVAETAGREVVLLGEEHGTREIPLLARALFESLRPHGFDTLVIEVSPPSADALDKAARDGVAGLERLMKAWPPGPAFYFWRTEAEMLAAVRASVRGPRPVLWGVDYEVTGDRRLISLLKARAPASARAAVAELEAASNAGWAKWAANHNPAEVFMFSGDPALVRKVRAAWPKPDRDSDLILTTLEETLEINRLFGANKGWESNQRRARLMRANLVARLRAAEAEGRKPKFMMKMGENHVMRGVTATGDFDVGTMAAEVAELRGGTSFSVIVGGGRDGRHGVLNPAFMTTEPVPVDMLGDDMGLGFLLDAVAQMGPVVVDLRPLRALVSSPARLKAFNNPEAVRAIHAFDSVLVWNGCTPAVMLTQA